MTAQAQGTSVTASTMVNAPIERSFTVFTEGIGDWWEADRHIGEGELVGMVFEPRVGGNIYDRFADGSELRWARVLAYEPPHRVVFSWDISTQWKVEADPARTSEVEVTFTAEGPDRTRVVLEHRNLERHGEGWEAHRDAVGGPDGWQVGLDDFVKVAEAG